MAGQEVPQEDQDLGQLVHDLRHCLHVIGLSSELLPNVRNDDRRFAEVCGWIDNERIKAGELLNQLVERTRPVDEQ